MNIYIKSRDRLYIALTAHDAQEDAEISDVIVGMVCNYHQADNANNGLNNNERPAHV